MSPHKPNSLDRLVRARKLVKKLHREISRLCETTPDIDESWSDLLYDLDAFDRKLARAIEAMLSVLKATRDSRPHE